MSKLPQREKIRLFKDPKQLKEILPIWFEVRFCIKAKECEVGVETKIEK